MNIVVEYREDRVNGEAKEVYSVGDVVHVVSPTRSSECCISGMVRIGEVQTCIRKYKASNFENENAEWNREVTYVWKRCIVCGFTVKGILKVRPCEEEFEKVRNAFNGMKISRGWEE